MDWPSGREVLAARCPFNPQEPIVLSSPKLPPAERRRATEAVKLALAVCGEAIEHAGADAATTPSIFSSSGGDGQTITGILERLATGGGELSPTAFHNSVHNAPSGYWTIASQSRESSTSLCAYDWSFAAGLIEAATQALDLQRSVVLASYDLSYPEPLHAVRPIPNRFGVALVLSPKRTRGSLAALSISIQRRTSQVTKLPHTDLEALREQNPTARALPLLIALASETSEEIVLEYVASNVLVLAINAEARGVA